MNLMAYMFRFLFILFLVRIIGSFLIVFLRSFNANKENNISREKETTQSTEQGTETKEKPVVQMVEGELCGTHVQKEKAYIVVDSNDKRHYFCSWDCRQKYIKENSNIK